MTTDRFTEAEQLVFVVCAHTGIMGIRTCLAFDSKSFDDKGVLKEDELVGQGQTFYEAVIDLCIHLITLEDERKDMARGRLVSIFGQKIAYRYPFNSNPESNNGEDQTGFLENVKDED